MIRNELIKGVGEIEVVIEGEAKGADRLAGIVADELGIPVMKFPAQWGLYGKAAGPIRNQQMLDEGKPDEVWVFHDSLSTSKGSKDMAERATKAGFRVKLFDHKRSQL
jgi:hypothetical protein